jgi:hypothetical protein
MERLCKSYYVHGFEVLMVACMKIAGSAAWTSETWVKFYHTTQCYNPEDSYLHTMYVNALSNNC